MYMHKKIELRGSLIQVICILIWDQDGDMTEVRVALEATEDFA